MSREGRKIRNRVGKYEFGRVLGEGTFGKVHLARDVETGEKRAIKVISKDRVVKDKMTEQVSLHVSGLANVRFWVGLAIGWILVFLRKE